ncbi:MAG: hypothetical protein ACJ8C4_06485 [Gemmataceae bacterium]
MQNAAIVLAFAALGGLALAAIRLNGTPRPPTWMALIHGIIAATGLVLLGITVFGATSTSVPPMAMWSFGVFVVAALGGAVMFLGYHLRGLALPIAFVGGHGLIAVTGFVMLLMSMRV